MGATKKVVKKVGGKFVTVVVNQATDPKKTKAKANKRLDLNDTGGRMVRARKVAKTTRKANSR